MIAAATVIALMVSLVFAGYTLGCRMQRRAIVAAGADLADTLMKHSFARIVDRGRFEMDGRTFIVIEKAAAEPVSRSRPRRSPPGRKARP